MEYMKKNLESQGVAVPRINECKLISPRKS